jgi:hypothetical protein
MNGSEPSPSASATPGSGRSPILLIGCLGLVAIGAVTWFAVVGTDPVRAWRIYLVNFLFFTGIGVGGVLFVCAVNTASGAWARNVKRVAEGLGIFLPVSFLLFLLMIPGLKTILPWVEHPYGPSWWLDLSFLTWRNALGLLILALLGVYIIYLSLRIDFGLQEEEEGAGSGGSLHRLLTRGWKGGSTEAIAARRRLVVLSPVYAIVFALVLTVIGVDLIMSLKAGWYSTLIGAYYFVGCFYTSLAALLLAVFWTRRKYGLQERIVPKHFHDIALLTMGFGIVTGDFFYTQLFVIWYGNLPMETTFLIDRWAGTPWRTVGILVLLFCFALPLLASLRRSLKQSVAPMVVFSVVVLCAMWMERFLLIGPSLTGSDKVLFGPMEVLVSLGFLGLLGMTFLLFMGRVPPITLRDPVFDDIGETR